MTSERRSSPAWVRAIRRPRPSLGSREIETRPRRSILRISRLAAGIDVLARSASSLTRSGSSELPRTINVRHWRNRRCIAPASKIAAFVTPRAQWQAAPIGRVPRTIDIVSTSLSSISNPDCNCHRAHIRPKRNHLDVPGVWNHDDPEAGTAAYWIRYRGARASLNTL